MADPRLRLAVVGAGPKALFALEALAAALRAGGGPTRPLQMTVIDSGDHPGTGAAYHPGQPQYLRLNVTAAILDRPATDTVDSFPVWVRTAHPAWADRQDEVLLATSHAADHPGALTRTWQAPQPLLSAMVGGPSLFAVDAVPAGSRVAVRGAALTFIDAALALTEGRGGSFVNGPAGKLVHRRASTEPAVILPTARSGLLLDAKPDPGEPDPVVQRVLDDARQRLLGAAGRSPGIGPDAVTDLLTATAQQLLRECDGVSPTQAERSVALTLDTGAEPDLTGPGRATAALRRSVEVASGARPPGPARVLGQSWAALYPVITAALRGSDAPESEWRRFRERARVLERFAFGPPLVNARKLLAMIDSEAVDLAWLEAGTTIDADGLQDVPDGAAAPDVVVDAVLAPPGIRELDDPLFRSLLAERILSLRPGRRGPVVDPDGTPLATDGTRAAGLALIGRPSEDHVIGHDSLNRHLHTEIDHWADRLHDRLTRSVTAPDRTVAAPSGTVPHDTEDLR